MPKKYKQENCENNIQISPDSDAVLRISNNTMKNISIADTASGQIFDVESGCVINIKNLNMKPITKISIVRTIDCKDACNGCNNVTIKNLSVSPTIISDPQLNSTRTLSLAQNTSINISNKITNTYGRICAPIELIIIDSTATSIGSGESSVPNSTFNNVQVTFTSEDANNPPYTTTTSGNSIANSVLNVTWLDKTTQNIYSINGTTLSNTNTIGSQKSLTGGTFNDPFGFTWYITDPSTYTYDASTGIIVLTVSAQAVPPPGATTQFTSFTLTIPTK